MSPHALTLYCTGKYAIESHPLPEVEEGEVLVRVLAVGICASDAKCYAGATRYWGKYIIFQQCHITVLELVLYSVLSLRSVLLYLLFY